MDSTYRPALGFVKRVILLPRDPPNRRLDRSPRLVPLQRAGRPCPGAAGVSSHQPGRGLPDRAGLRALPDARTRPVVRQSGARLRQRHRARVTSRARGTISTARSSGSGSAWPGPWAPGGSSSWTPVSAPAIPDFSTDFSTGTTASSASPCATASAVRTTPSCISSSCRTASSSPGARPACFLATSGCRPGCAMGRHLQTVATRHPADVHGAGRLRARCRGRRGRDHGAGAARERRSSTKAAWAWATRRGTAISPVTSARRFSRGARGSGGASGDVSRSTAISSSTRRTITTRRLPPSTGGSCPSISAGFWRRARGGSGESG